MAKCGAICFVAMSGLCLVALVMAEEETTVTPSEYNFRGLVYCDTCWVTFISKLSRVLKGAKVRLECRDPDVDVMRDGKYDPLKNLMFSKEAVTDEEGMYNVTMSAEYDIEQCEIKLSESPEADCSQIPYDTNVPLAAGILTSPNNPSEKRVYPLRFVSSINAPECSTEESLKYMRINNDDY